MTISPLLDIMLQPNGTTEITKLRTIQSIHAPRQHNSHLHDAIPLWYTTIRSQLSLILALLCHYENSQQHQALH